MASIKDIALKCGVSIATVSKAINNKKDISEETRDLVLKTARELGYCLSTRTLNATRTYNIGVLFADESGSGFRHDYLSGVLDSFKRKVEECGYDITFINCSDKERGRVSYLEQCRRHGFDGVLVASAVFFSDEIRELMVSDIPVVTIDHVFDNRVSVMSDNMGGMSELVEYVISKGHRRIAFMHGESSAVTSGRLSGFFRTMERHGIPVPDEYVMEVPFRKVDATFLATELLLGLRNPPTCILFSDDFAAMGGMNAIRARGMKIPEDISIAGFDGMQALQYLEPRLTTIIQDTESIGAVAGKKLIDLIETPRTAVVEHVVVPTMLAEGQTIHDISVKRK